MTKFAPYVFKHLRRNWIRTLSTVVAMGVCIFLFCTLQSFLAAIKVQLEASSASRLVTRHAVGLTNELPLSYAARIQAVPGVKSVATLNWFGGSLPAKKEGKSDEEEAGMDWSSFVPSMAIEPEDTYFAMYPEYQVPPDQWREFMTDQRGAVIGRKLADKYSWKLGDTFHLESFIPPYRKDSGPFEFVVKAIFESDPGKYPGTDTNVMFFHYKYLYESTGRHIQAGTFTIDINDATQAGTVSKAVDATFSNSDAETHTETESAFKAGFISMAGNLALLLNAIGLAVCFTILLVTANTMGMAIRERRIEIGVLKTLGFPSSLVMGLVVAEALLIGALGGLLGLASSRALFFMFQTVPGITSVLSGFGLSGLTLTPAVAAIGFGAALLLGLLAGIVPAMNAYRARITELFRTV
jgi:putative ABC transport system permease protein